MHSIAQLSTAVFRSSGWVGGWLVVWACGLLLPGSDAMWCVGRWMLGSQYGLAVWLRDGWEGGERGFRGRATVKERERGDEKEREAYCV
jgi:hypothetical protein